MNLLKEEQTDWNEIHEVVFLKKKSDFYHFLSFFFSSFLSSLRPETALAATTFLAMPIPVSTSQHPRESIHLIPWKLCSGDLMHIDLYTWWETGAEMRFWRRNRPFLNAEIPARFYFYKVHNNIYT